MESVLACNCSLGIKPLLLRPLLSTAVDSSRYVTTVGCLSGIPNVFKKQMQKAHAKKCSRKDSQEATQISAAAKVMMAQEEVQDQKGTKTAATTEVNMAQDKVHEFEFGNYIQHVAYPGAADGNEKQKAVKPPKPEEIIVRSMAKQIQNQVACIEALREEAISLKEKVLQEYISHEYEVLQARHSKVSSEVTPEVTPEDIRMQDGTAPISDALAEEVCMKLGHLDELLLELIEQHATDHGTTADFSFFNTMVDDTSEASLLVIRRTMKKQIRELAAKIDAFQKDLAVSKAQFTRLFKFEMAQGK